MQVKFCCYRMRNPCYHPTLLSGRKIRSEARLIDFKNNYIQIYLGELEIYTVLALLYSNHSIQARYTVSTISET